MNDSNAKIRILVADDDPDILGYFRAIIQDPRYELCLVPNGVRAIEEAKNNKIDLAFLDINMPEMGGIETLQRWKKLQPKTQIVMISSYSDGNLVREAIQSGAYTYLFKPLNKMDIFSVTVKSLKNTGIHDVFSFE
jgi:two-component system response regulator YesN